MQFPVQTLADGLGHPEGPDVLPNGDVVMVETYTSKIIAWSPSRGLYDYAPGPTRCTSRRTAARWGAGVPR